MPRSTECCAEEQSPVVHDDASGQLSEEPADHPENCVKSNSAEIWVFEKLTVSACEPDISA